MFFDLLSQASERHSRVKAALWPALVAGRAPARVRLVREMGDRFDMRSAPFAAPAENRMLPAGDNAATVFAREPARQKSAWEYVTFVTGPIGQTMMANHTGYMPGNQRAIGAPELLGKFYAANPNHMRSIRKLPRVTGWYAFPGDNALKITDVLKHARQSFITLKRSPGEALAGAAKAVQALLPKNCVT